MANIMTIPVGDVIHDISVDLHNKTSLESVSLMQYDKDYVWIRATVWNRGDIYPITSEKIIAFACTKPDGNGVYNTCGIDSEGRILYRITENTSAMYGDFKAEFRLYDTESIDGVTNTKEKSTFNFKMIVDKSSLQDSTVISTPEFNVLTDLIATVGDLVADAEAAKNACEIATVNANAATSSANSAASLANEKATLANTKATLADEKATLANSAASSATSAATACNSAADLANQKATLADTKATLANEKATLADSAATNANGVATQLSNETLKIFKPAVTTYSALATTYPNPLNAWTVYVDDEQSSYRYNGTSWINLGYIASVDIANTTSAGIVKASNDVNVAVDGTMSVPKIGDITTLTTTDKTNTVAAINELNSDLGNKLDKTGDSKDNTVSFTEYEAETDIESTDAHATLFGKILKSTKTFRTDISNKVSKGELVINVKDYGAKGDGTTDDSDAIQLAIDNSATKKQKVFFPIGNYLISKRIILKGDTCTLCGDGVILLSTYDSGFTPDTAETGATNKIVFDGITLDGSLYNYTYESTQFQYGVISINKLRYCSIHNCTFKNIHGDVVTVAGYGSISGNRFLDCGGYNTDLLNHGDAIHVYNPSLIPTTKGLFIKNNLIKTSIKARNAITLEFNANNVKVSANAINGYDAGIWCEGAEYCTIDTNRIEKCNVGINMTTSNNMSALNNYFESNPNFTYKYSGSGGGFNNCKNIIFENNTFTVPTNRQVFGSDSTQSYYITMRNNIFHGIVNFNIGIENLICENNSFKNVVSSETITNHFADLKYSIIKSNTSDTNEVFQIHGNDVEIAKNRLYNLYIINTTGNIRIIDNILSTPISTYGVGGDNECSANIILSDNASITNVLTDGGNGFWCTRFFENEKNFRKDTSGNFYRLVYSGADYQSAKGNTLTSTPLTAYNIAIPTVGAWKKGDIILNLNPVASGNIGWVCITDGTPGTWKSFGTISA